MKLSIIGAGMMARAVAHDFLRQPDVKKVVLIDRDRAALAALAGRLASDRVETVEADAADGPAMSRLLRGCAAGVSCVPYFFNLGLTRAAIRAGAHFCDLGGNNDVVERQLALDTEARRAGVTVVPDCGLAPGLVSILAADVLARFDRCDAIRLRVGGLPRRPKPPLGYAIVFSANGLINEYAEPCLVLRGGRVRTVAPLADLERLRFPAPFGELEAFNTSGGVSTLTRTLRGKVRDLDYKTIRYPGHCEQFRLLFDLGLAGTDPVEVDGAQVVPRRLLIRRLEETLGFTRDDVVLLRVEAEGVKDGRRRHVRRQLVDRADRRSGLTAMMRCTGFPAAQVALDLARGKAKRTGVAPGELAIEPGPHIDALRRRGLALAITTRR